MKSVEVTSLIKKLNALNCDDSQVDEIFKNCKKINRFDNYLGNINNNKSNCLYDIDLQCGDEMLAYQNIIRNEPTRVIQGQIDNTRIQIKRYVAEELETTENKEWWGEYEY